MGRSTLDNSDASDPASDADREELMKLLRIAAARLKAEIERERRNPFLRWYRRIMGG